MENKLTLSHLFQQADCEFIVYDLSRRVSEISQKTFIDVEENRQPYPFPIQKKAQMAIAFWKPQSPPWIWFLTFPLDERSLLEQAALGDFIQYLASAMGKQLDKTLTKEEEEEQLANNPYTFRPLDDKKAIFHAYLTKKLQLPASQYYHHAQDYLSGALNWDHWQGVGVQGFADICVRIGSHNNAQLIRKSLKHLPISPKYALLGCLEHIQISEKLAQLLAGYIEEQMTLSEPDIFLVSAYLRALSGANDTQIKTLLDQIISNKKFHHQEIFIAIAGRCWKTLADNTVLDNYFAALNIFASPKLVFALYGDLVMLPSLRPHILSLLHQEKTSALKTVLLTQQQ